MQDRQPVTEMHLKTPIVREPPGLPSTQHQSTLSPRRWRTGSHCYVIDEIFGRRLHWYRKQKRVKKKEGYLNRNQSRAHQIG